jgi:hypothetical protein
MRGSVPETFAKPFRPKCSFTEVWDVPLTGRAGDVAEIEVH